jgi:NADPH:quinone reductase-like Zn-dependent oxidoreductase
MFILYRDSGDGGCSTKLFAAGRIKAIASKSYPLAEAQQALAYLVAGQVFGKLVLTA